MQAAGIGTCFFELHRIADTVGRHVYLKSRVSDGGKFRVEES